MAQSVGHFALRVGELWSDRTRVQKGGRMKPNQPAAPNAGIAPRLTIGHRWLGVGKPERSTNEPGQMKASE